MHWTKKAPVKEGWYWVERNNAVKDDRERLTEIMHVRDLVYPLPNFLMKTARWAGPIPKPTNKPTVSKEDYEDIVCYLNNRTGKSFKSTSRKTCNLIRARYNEGFNKEDHFKVIDNQSKKWLQDPDMMEYLRPETLFGTKFESYLQNGNCISNQQIKKMGPRKPVTIQDLMRAENILANLGRGKFEEFVKSVRMSSQDREAVINKYEGKFNVQRLVGGIG